jgi:hypothetical protein
MGCFRSRSAPQPSRCASGSPVDSVTLRLAEQWRLVFGWQPVSRVAKGVYLHFNRVPSISYATLASGLCTGRPNPGNFERCVVQRFINLIDATPSRVSSMGL